jgi:mono/diheme cytochrome c family protein
MMFGTLALLAVAAWPAAAKAASVTQGEVLAKRWCASCHVVASGQKSGNTQAPPFSEVAKKPRLDAPMLALYLLAPHPKMPDMNLSRDEAADLAAYIKSQGQ